MLSGTVSACAICTICFTISLYHLIQVADLVFRKRVIAKFQPDARDREKREEGRWAKRRLINLPDGLRAFLRGGIRAGLKRAQRGYWITDSQITGRSAARCPPRCRRPFSSSFSYLGPALPGCPNMGQRIMHIGHRGLLSKRRKRRSCPFGGADTAAAGTGPSDRLD